MRLDKAALRMIFHRFGVDEGLGNAVAVRTCVRLLGWRFCDLEFTRFIWMRDLIRVDDLVVSDFLSFNLGLQWEMVGIQNLPYGSNSLTGHLG